MLTALVSPKISLPLALAATLGMALMGAAVIAMVGGRTPQSRKPGDKPSCSLLHSRPNCGITLCD